MFGPDVTQFYVLGYGWSCSSRPSDPRLAHRCGGDAEAEERARPPHGRRGGAADARAEPAERTRHAAAGSRQQRHRRSAPRAAGDGQVAEAAVADAGARLKDYPGLKEDVRRSLLDIVRVDPGFDTDAFIRGARQAYEMIVTAFAEGNRKILKGLLDAEAYRDFDNAITERETRGEQNDQDFVGVATRHPQS